MIYDSIVIGKGPAGISAAIYIKRGGLDVLVLGSGAGALERAEKIDNFYGFPQTVSGKELLDRGLEQAKRLGVTVKTEEVLALNMEEYFTVVTARGRYETKTVVFATGKSRVGLKVAGFEELKGKGISFCATCDGFFFRDKKLAVVGAGDYAAHELKDLQAFSQDVTVFTNGEKTVSSLIPADIPVIHEPITGFYGSGKLESLKTSAGEYPIDGAFIAIGTANAADFAAKTGIAMEGASISVNRDFMTNMPGIFAAGDCTGGLFQIAKAVSDGAQAGLGVVSYLREG
ncbi:MAG: NAD(P)/FAD-dependent oxidoreductase [Spirochaetaceae bacterium]|jgi:thioredoxin reductase (NADPH)|nr:NAD(P)/FAD-dependent oxidoreductase [Spirochaetaceae bacterium]